MWVGHAEAWKRAAGLEALAALPQVTLVPLDLTDARSVAELAAEIGGKVDILVNNAEHHRAHGIVSRHGTDVARAEMEVNYFRPVAAGAGVRSDHACARRRRRHERGGLGQRALRVCPEQFSGAWHVLGVEGGGALAVAMPARGDAARAGFAS